MCLCLLKFIHFNQTNITMELSSVSYFFNHPCLVGYCSFWQLVTMLTNVWCCFAVDWLCQEGRHWRESDENGKLLAHSKCSFFMIFVSILMYSDQVRPSQWPQLCCTIIYQISMSVPSSFRQSSCRSLLCGLRKRTWSQSSSRSWLPGLRPSPKPTPAWPAFPTGRTWTRLLWPCLSIKATRSHLSRPPNETMNSH